MRNIVSLAIVALVAGCFSSADSPDNQWALVQNHIWIDHFPKNERDMVKQVAFIDHDGQKVGVRGQSSRFRFFIDVLAWARRGTEIHSTVLQTNEKLHGTFKAWRCKSDRFELCLELRHGDHVRKYFSRNDWIIDGQQDAAKIVSALPFDDSAPGTAAADDDDDVVDGERAF